MKEQLPKSITAMRAVTYDVARVVEDLMEGEERKPEDITLEDVLDYIYSWANEDLSSARREIIFQDENGKEVVNV